ncbi:unnamed protein product, partial [marine sediment metagenome]
AILAAILYIASLAMIASTLTEEPFLEEPFLGEPFLGGPFLGESFPGALFIVVLGTLLALFIVLGAFVAIYATVVMCIMVYKMWKAIQDGHARTTPGKAVGLMFVPFFNFYWVFQAYWGFSQDYNSYIERHSMATNRLPERLFLAYAILSVASLAPFTWMLASIPCLVIFIILVVKICDAVNALQTAAPMEPTSAAEVGGE